MNGIELDFACAAEKAVGMAESRNRGRLNYSDASLAIVEEMLVETSPFVGELMSDQLETLAQDFGCYILEVGRRTFGGKYYWHDQRDQPVLAVGEPVFRMARSSARV